MEQQTENLETLRQILENLVYFSVEEEKLDANYGKFRPLRPQGIFSLCTSKETLETMRV